MDKEVMPKDYIENIHKRHLESDKEYTLDSLAGAIDRLGKAFARYGSFLMEFIQNADDEESKSVLIEVNKDSVRILNDGKPFSEKNVSSICKVGRSSKTAKDYIGYLGVGFKAVFLISECPEIHSGSFRFKFDKNEWDDPKNIPWQVIPLWIDNPGMEITGKFTTAFNLKLKQENLLEKLEEEVSTNHLSDRILLFLRHIESIEIVNSIKNSRRRIEKSLLSKTSEYEIFQLQEYHNDLSTHQTSWLLFRLECEVEKDVKEDYVTKEWERDTVEKREVIAAFKLDDHDNLVKEEKGTAHIGVFSFLPIKEVPSGLNFLIQADFLTGPGRVELARDCLWNNWLAKQIYMLITEKCIHTLLAHEKWRMNFTDILASSEGGHEIFENYIKRPLIEYMETNAVLIAEDGSHIKPDEAISIDPHIRDLIMEKDLEALYPNKKVIHKECSSPWPIVSRVENGPSFNATSGFGPKMEDLLDLKARERNVDFFVGFYREYLLTYFNSSPSTLANLKSRYVMLTDEFELTNAQSLYINPHRLTIPREIKHNFKILHAVIAADTEILEFLKKLDIPELSQEHIHDMLKKQTVPEVSNKWDSLSYEDKIKHIKLYKDLCDKGLDTRDLAFITLKTKKGEWLDPSKILFSKEYNPDHNIEALLDTFLKLIENGLLEIEKDSLGMPLDFLSPDFIEGIVEGEKKEWWQFFSKLGVDSRLNQEQREEKKGITQRIGILTALHFEKKQGRRARELGESEKPGYDIQSEGRCIEVKGRSTADPDIFMTTKEFKTLRDKREQYFVYVVKDALKHPTLCVTRGDKLLDITDIKTIIPYNQWNNSKDEIFEL